MAYKIKQIKTKGSPWKKENQLIILWNGAISNYGRTPKAIKMFKERAKASHFTQGEIDNHLVYYLNYDDRYFEK